MKKLFYIPVALLAIVACQKNELVIEETGDEPVWRYVTASMDNDATKAILVNDGEGGKDFQWTVGDVIAICVNKKNDETYDCVTRPGEITSVEDGIAVIKYNAKGAYSIVNAWYPYSVQNSTTGIPSAPSTVAANQVYKNGAVSVPLKATNSFPIFVSDEDRLRDTSNKDTSIEGLTFAEATTDYAVLSFRMKQSAYYLRETEDITSMDFSRYNPTVTPLQSVSVAISGGNTYTLDLSTADVKSFKEYADSYDADSKRVTAEWTYELVVPAIDSKDLKITFTTRDGVPFTKNKSGFSIEAGHIKRMPVFDLTGYHFWKFGTSFEKYDSNGLVYWFRGDYNNTHQFYPNNGTYFSEQEKHATLIPDKNDSKYYYKFEPLYANRFNSNKANFVVSELARITLSKEYPIFVIATQRPKSLDGATVNIHKMMPNTTGYFYARTIQHENSGENAYIMVDMEATNNLLNSNTIVDQQNIGLELSISFSGDPSDLLIYYAGTFKTTTEAEDFFTKYSFE